MAEMFGEFIALRKPPKSTNRRRLVVAAALVGSCGISTAGAEMGASSDIQVETTFTANYGVSLRQHDPSAALVDPTFYQNPALQGAIVNMDDGNRNFDAGIVSNRISFLGELDIYKGNTGFFARASAFYDHAYMQSNDNDSPFTVNKSGPNDEFTKKTEDLMGQRLRLLDAYAYTLLPLGDDAEISLRLGNQMVQWGESMFFANIAGAQAPVDANKANLPGITVKDILLPVPQLSANLALNQNLNLMAYYQFKWAETEIPPVGSYFSYSDIFGPGAEFMSLGPLGRLTRQADQEPDDGGQGGIGAQIRVTDFTEISVYYLRYHDKVPMINFNPLAGAFQYQYFEDISLLGFSASTQISGVNVAGEISLRQDTPLLVASPFGFPAAKTGDLWQAQVNFLWALGPNFLAESTSIVGELVHMEASVDNAELVGDDTAAAMQLSITPSYLSVMPGWAIAVPFSLAMVVDGDMPPTPAIGVLVSEDDIRVSLGVTMTYLGNLEFGMSYNAMLGDPDPNKAPLADRDYFTLNVKYSL